MKRPLFHPVFIVAIVIFLLHLLMERVFLLNTGIAGRYLENILAMPVILTLFLEERRFFSLPDRYLSTIEIIVATIYVSIIAEVFFPLWSKKFVADIVDVFLYCAGSLIFYLMYKVKRKGSAIAAASKIQ